MPALKRVIPMIAAAAVYLASGAAYATTGDELLTMCKYYQYFNKDDVKKLGRDHIADLHQCTGYIAAASYGMWMARKDFCYPSGLTNAIIMRLTVMYLQGHPEKLHRSAALLVNEAFTEAYPCPAKPNGGGL